MSRPTPPMSRRSPSRLLARAALAAAAALAVVALPAAVAAESEFNEALSIGDKAPAFEALPAAAGGKLSLADFKDKKAVVVVFTCNHCPVAQAYEDRFKTFAKEYAEKGVALVAISVSSEPEDTLPNMTERVKAEGINYPYVRDESQAIGKAYGASVTPQTFVLGPDRKVRYMGAWDDSWRPGKPPEETYVRDAVDAILAGKEVAVTEKRQVGCGITYK